MTDDTDELLEPYAYDQPEYAGAFETFLTHTDQKIKAIGWLTDCVRGLRSRSLFVDAPAGEGSTTAALVKFFDRGAGKIPPFPRRRADTQARPQRMWLRRVVFHPPFKTLSWHWKRGPKSRSPIFSAYDIAMRRR